ncbi:Uncharacterized protein HZ326_3540 [Fusarium oxysporum f. sp. albedinis]|nr:Uncharacterized protein HZ326_3540 [Fusarium oxysporum f. sp. albedinis]
MCLQLDDAERLVTRPPRVKPRPPQQRRMATAGACRSFCCTVRHVIVPVRSSREATGGPSSISSSLPYLNW